MRTVKIIEGIYGYRNAQGTVRPVRMGETVDLTEEEADRLVAIGVAELVATDPVPQEDGEQGDTTPGNDIPAESNGGVEGNLNPEQLKDLKMDELKEMAVTLDVDTKGLNSKAKLIDAICELVAHVDEVDEVDEADSGDEVPPELGAGAPV